MRLLQWSREVLFRLVRLIRYLTMHSDDGSLMFPTVEPALAVRLQLLSQLKSVPNEVPAVANLFQVTVQGRS